MIKAIIWDFDGVIVDSLQNLYDMLGDAYKSYKKDTSKLKGSHHNGMEGFYNNFINAEPKTPKITIEQFENMLKNHPQYNLTEKVLIKENIEFIKKTKENGTLHTVASNSTKERLAYEVKNLNLKDLFEFTISADDVSFPKPNPEMIIETVNWLDLKPEEILFIDDSEIALQAGIEAGIKTALYTNKNKETIENKKINLIIDNIKNLDLKNI